MNTTNPYAPPQAAVQDVVNSDIQELAGRGMRLLTMILDCVILGLMVNLPVILVAVNKPDAPDAYAIPFDLLMLAGIVGWLWLTVMFVARNGQSIGKKITGIKVVRSDGSKASLGRIVLLRNVLNLLLTMIPFYLLADVLLIFSEKQQCAHDKLADTIVIKA